LAGLAVSVVPIGLGQDEKPQRSGFTSMINVETLINNYCRLLARKYNLTDEQDEYTQLLIHEKAGQFLAKHEDELRVLVDRMFEVRSGAADMDPAELVEWGKAVLPMYEEAKGIIVEGNAEWREILTEEQQRIHDDDLKLMHESFATTEDQLYRMITGEMTVEEFRNPKRPNRAERRNNGMRLSRNPPEPVVRTEESVAPPPQTAGPDPRPVVGEAGRPTSLAPKPANPPVPRAGRARQPRVVQPEGANVPDRNRPPRGRQATPAGGKDGDLGRWEAYVRDFIRKYQLNEAQTEKANAILKDCKLQAERLITSNKPRMDKLAEEIKKLAGTKSQSPEALEQLTKLNEQKSKLMEPVEQIFDKRLKPRLETLPTRAQRKAAEEAEKNGAAKGAAGADAEGERQSRLERLRAARPKPVPPEPKPEPESEPGDEEPPPDDGSEE